MTENQEESHTEINPMRQDMMDKCQKAAEKQAARIAAEERRAAVVAEIEQEKLDRALKVCGIKDATKRSAFMKSQCLTSLHDLLSCEPEDGKEMVATHNRNTTPEFLVGYMFGKNVDALIFWLRLQARLYEPPLLDGWCACSMR